MGQAATIGPNAVIQLVPALTRKGFDGMAPQVFAGAGVTGWLADPPAAMVDERLAAGLHRALRAGLPPGQASLVLAEAGRLTADYLLAARIPGPAQAILKLLPASLSASLLVGAIRAHAWTFAGSGRFSARGGPPLLLEIRNNPLCAGEHAPAPVCSWHAAVFRRLFEVLVSHDVRVDETGCEACGDPACRFSIDWS
ncbi:bacteriochlorophyll 4-vinyl reductase (plasmid) [Skermanella mucosa]|uniref:bacteriochlorophyll 4-vinyl reductase n=1 Tax=Skermanella mucosa TaxID=1789672 RepID=UPI00192CE0FC|nr:bacteriochlorophyll 4-vinyl reductase [Skermanella mucosa]UEM24179.1 bacteriochlorophyll 4-vinyl reductase [Skermanella mucosa]